MQTSCQLWSRCSHTQQKIIRLHVHISLECREASEITCRQCRSLVINLIKNSRLCRALTFVTKNKISWSQMPPCQQLILYSVVDSCLGHVKHYSAFQWSWFLEPMKTFVCQALKLSAPFLRWDKSIDIEETSISMDKSVRWVWLNTAAETSKLVVYLHRQKEDSYA